MKTMQDEPIFWGFERCPYTSDEVDEVNHVLGFNGNSIAAVWEILGEKWKVKGCSIGMILGVFEEIRDGKIFVENGEIKTKLPPGTLKFLKVNA